MNSIWIHNSYFREEIRVSLDEAYYFCGNEKGFKAKFAFVKTWHADEWKLSYFEFSITSRIHRQTSFLWDLLNCKLPKRGRKLKQSLEVNILTRELYVFTHVSASCLRNVYCLNLAFDPRRKKDISGYIWPRSFIQMVKCSFLDEKIAYQSFYGAPLTFKYFLLQGKVLCFACIGKSLARCLLSKAFRIPCRKSYIFDDIWHKSFIQTVKCFFFK